MPHLRSGRSLDCPTNGTPAHQPYAAVGFHGYDGTPHALASYLPQIATTDGWSDHGRYLPLKKCLGWWRSR